MAVPAHDVRDHEFARTFALPIVQVVSGGEKPIGECAFVGEGSVVNSDFLNGLSSTTAKHEMIAWLSKNGKGKPRVTYRLRDWLFSRQRYWGEPFPIVHLDDGSIMPLPDNRLPVELPVVDEYRPTAEGEPPLARAAESWLRVKLPDGRSGKLETNTMPQWAGSCWYYLRYLEPKNDKMAWSKEVENYWMPVDLYVGGVEHAVLHLLYARFWHKVLFDCGLVHTKEPFEKLFNQGMILGESYRDSRGKYYAAEDVENRHGKYFVKTTGDAIETQIEKMSKSKMNVVNPDDVIDQYGADAMRLYELFMGPLDQVKPWNMAGVEGVSRFLARVWRLVIDERAGGFQGRLVDAPGNSEPVLWQLLHKTIKKVTEHTEGMYFNTAISQMMIFVNEATNSKTVPRETMSLFLKVVAPYAPHLAEELWEKLGQKELIALAPWPKYDPALCQEDTVTVVIQVNGKLREKLDVTRGLDRTTLEELARQTPKVQKALEGITPKKVIVVPDRLVNFVI